MIMVIHSSNQDRFWKMGDIIEWQKRKWRVTMKRTNPLNNTVEYGLAEYNGEP